MCSPARCQVSGKTTWTGCGMHADAIMDRVPQDQRCEGHSRRSSVRFTEDRPPRS